MLQIRPISTHKAHHFPCSAIAFVRGTSKWYTNSFNKDSTVKELNEEQQKSPKESDDTRKETSGKDKFKEGGLVEDSQKEKDTSDSKAEAQEATDKEETNDVEPELVDPKGKEKEKSHDEETIMKKRKTKKSGLCSIITASWGGDIKYWEYEDTEK